MEKLKAVIEKLFILGLLVAMIICFVSCICLIYMVGIVSVPMALSGMAFFGTIGWDLFEALIEPMD